MQESGNLFGRFSFFIRCGMRQRRGNMLERYDGKQVIVKTDDGMELCGTAEFCPSGYGLHEFGIEEESIEVDGTQLFLSQIASIDMADADTKQTADYFPFIGEMLEAPYWILDILPERVKEDAAGQYFRVDRYFRQKERRSILHRRQAELLLRLNCYWDMTVSFDFCKTWEINPDPESFAAKMTETDRGFLRVLWVQEGIMMDIDFLDSWMTIYCRDGKFPALLEKFADASGFFLWQGNNT